MRSLILFFMLIPAAIASQYPVSLGDSTVTIIQEQHGKGQAFIHVHQSETTALQAARAVIRAHGGSVITLAHNGKRNIVFTLNKVRYEFDPNRIYTDVGIKKTLTQFGPYSEEAHHAVRNLALKIEALLPAGKIIAVHNNESYSLKDYLPGHVLASDAQSLNRNPQNYYRNFFLVTQKKDQERFKKMNFNSVWQAMNATDDGSLSIFLANRTYVNVEAGYDQLAAQIKMLKVA